MENLLQRSIEYFIENLVQPSIEYFMEIIE